MNSMPSTQDENEQVRPTRDDVVAAIDQALLTNPPVGREMEACDQTDVIIAIVDAYARKQRVLALREAVEEIRTEARWQWMRGPTARPEPSIPYFADRLAVLKQILLNRAADCERP